MCIVIFWHILHLYLYHLIIVPLVRNKQMPWLNCIDGLLQDYSNPVRLAQMNLYYTPVPQQRAPKQAEVFI